MFGIDLTDKIKAFAPYGLILFLMMGGSNSPEFSDIDSISAQHVVEQIDKHTPAQGIREMYLSYLPSKTHVELPTETNLPDNSLGDFLRKAMEYPKKILNGSNGNQYGY